MREEREWYGFDIPLTKEGNLTIDLLSPLEVANGMPMTL
jgi:hypothetical protein